MMIVRGVRGFIWLLLLGSAFAQINNPGGGGALLYQAGASRTIAAPAVAPILGGAATTWAYVCEGRDAYGNILGVSAIGSTATGAATLDASHTIGITCPSTLATFDGNTPTWTIIRTTAGTSPTALSQVCAGIALGALCTDDGSVITPVRVAGALLGTGAAATFASYTIPANTLAAGKCLRATVHFSHTTGATSTAYTTTFGGTGSSAWLTSTAATRFGGVEVICNNPGTTQSQWYSILALGTGSAEAVGAPAKDTTAAQVLAFQFNVASTDQVSPAGIVVELVQ